MRNNLRQKGVALLTVLLIVALVSVLATEMGSRLQLQVQRASNLKDNNQAYWYAMGAEQFASKSILQLLDANKGVVSLAQPWHKELTYPLEGGGIEAQLQDQQRCFNLNGVRDATGRSSTGVSESLQAFHRLLSNSDLGIDSFTADTLRDSLADWLDEDANLRSYGAEDADYESRTHPYLAANGQLVSKSELRLINGVDLKWLSKLLQLVCVIPDLHELKININTLEAEQAPILSALLGVPLSDAQGLISSRPADGYENVQDFFAQPEIANLNLTDVQKTWLDVTTAHFILHTKARYNNAIFSMASLLKVNQQQQVTVIRREFGGVQ